MRESENDERDGPVEDGVEPFARDGVDDVFAGGRVDPSLVEASVDALFERFEEDTPEEVMLADRRASEADVVPAPPAFEAFAADVDDRLEATDDSTPDPEDVVGFEDAPEPRSVDASASGAGDSREVPGSSFDGSGEPVAAAESGWCPSEEPMAAADGEDPTRGDESLTASDGGQECASGTDAFEWVSEPVVARTVLADPESVRRFAADDGDVDGETGVFSRLRSSFPF
ncbi:hypothetical protein [Halorubellus litoreus]|uniref:Uncharacterized protein n=1 Tax=Halorubellus litoreus TaxID=755308 RepID=A0ABD5VCI5_9EURY